MSRHLTPSRCTPYIGTCLAEMPMRRLLRSLIPFLLLGAGCSAADAGKARPPAPHRCPPCQGPANRRARRRLLLGHGSGIRAGSGREQCRFGLCRRRGGMRPTTGQQRTHPPCRGVRITFDPSQVSYGPCCGSISRSPMTRRSSTARARTSARATDRRSSRRMRLSGASRALTSPAFSDPGICTADRHADRKRALFPGRNLSPGFHAQEPEASLHPRPRRAEGTGASPADA